MGLGADWHACAVAWSHLCLSAQATGGVAVCVVAGFYDSWSLLSLRQGAVLTGSILYDEVRSGL